MVPVALTIAGSDPSGGAGLQADLKTFHQHGVYGEAVVTLLTVQNTVRVEAVQTLDAAFVVRQIDSVLSDIPPAAAKTGALGNAAIVSAVAERLRRCNFPVIVDPVMVSKQGQALMDADAVRVFRREMLPLAWLVTPNLAEAAALAEMEVHSETEMLAAAARITRAGARHVLVKGGGLEGLAVDLLWTNGDSQRFGAQRVEGRAPHGAGCVLSAAITARVAKGERLGSAVQAAKAFVTEALQSAPPLGTGCTPLNFHQQLAREGRKLFGPWS